MRKSDPGGGLELVVLVVGAANDTFLGSLHLEDGVMRLGEFHGMHPTLRFVAFPTDPWADAGTGEALEATVPSMDGLVLTDAFAEGRHYSSRAVEQLARTLRPGKIGCPAAVFGGGALAQEWATLSAVPLLYVGDPQPPNALHAVKAIAKAMLQHVPAGAV